MSASYDVPTIDAQFSTLRRRVADLESSVYVYGDPDNTNNEDLTITSFTPTIAYYTAAGNAPRARITWSWDPISGPDPDDLTSDPVVDYMISVTPSGSPQVAPFNSTAGADTVTTDGHMLNTVVTGRVYAVTKKGLIGPVAMTTANVASDSTTPPQPSTPVLTAGLKVVMISWDGKDSSDNNMPEQFSHVEVHALIDGSLTFTPTPATLIDRLYGPGTTAVLGNDDYDPITVRFVAVSVHGPTGTPSTGVQATPLRAVATDVSGVVLPGSLGYSDNDNMLIDGSFEDPVLRAARSASGPYLGSWLWDDTAGNAAHGNWALRISGAWTSSGHFFLTGNPATTPGGYTNPNPQLHGIKVESGRKYYLSARIRGVSITGSVAVYVRFFDQDDAVSQAMAFQVTSATGSYEYHEGVVTAPANAKYGLVFVYYTGAGAEGYWWVDSVMMKPVITSMLIEDAAITRAKIADLAVGNAQIEGLDAGKIDTGFLAAVRIQAGTITGTHLSADSINGKTIVGALIQSNTGFPRVSMWSGGIIAYNAGAAETFRVNSADASVTVINGTITGGTIRTAASGARTQINGGALRVFDASNNQRILMENISGVPGLVFGDGTNIRLWLSANGSLMMNNASGNLAAQFSAASFEGFPQASIWGPTVSGSQPYLQVGARSWESSTQRAILMSAGGDNGSWFQALGNGHWQIYSPNGQIMSETGVNGVSITTGNNTGISIWPHSGGIYLWNTTARASHIPIGLYVTASGNPRIYQLSSLRSSKEGIDDIEKLVDPSSLLDVPVVDFWDKGDHLAYTKALRAEALRRKGRNLTDEEEIGADDLGNWQKQPRRFPGVVAEDLEAAGLELFCTYDTQTGDLTGVQYDRIPLLLIPLVKELREQVATLTARIDHPEGTPQQKENHG